MKLNMMNCINFYFIAKDYLTDFDINEEIY